MEVPPRFGITTLHHESVLSPTSGIGRLRAPNLPSEWRATARPTFVWPFSLILERAGSGEGPWACTFFQVMVRAKIGVLPHSARG